MIRFSTLRPLGVSLALGSALSLCAAAQPEVSAGRFEETSPLVAWTGAWSKNSLPANSAGSAMLTMDAGSQASFTFSGVSVSWIGYRDEWCGLADVFLDGALVATVDTYATPARPQATIYTVNGLREGRHTLSIHPKGTHASGSAGSWVWVDAFVVGDGLEGERSGGADPRRSRLSAAPDDPASRNADTRGAIRGPRGGQASRFEQDDRSVSWSGPWSTNSLAVHSGRGARLAMEPTSKADFAFVGTGVSWIGYKDEWSGIAEVWLDGRLRSTVDTYAKPAQAQITLFTIDGLRDGPHTLTIQPTGRRRPASGGAWVWVDAFSVVR